MSQTKLGFPKFLGVRIELGGMSDRKEKIDTCIALQLEKLFKKSYGRY